MTNVPAIQFATTVPQLSAEVVASFGNMFDETFNDLGSSGVRRLRPRKMDFLIADGGNQEIVQNDKMFAVLVGSAPCNHAVWYEHAYAPGQEPAAPDLVWKMPTPTTFPDALPAQFRSKIMRDGREVWGFQTLRRTVWIRVRPNQNGTISLEYDRPFVFDISSMSLYGKSMPEQNMYKWAGIRDVCAKYSGNGITVFPSMFITQIVLDTTVTVTGPVMFRPMTDPNSGHLQFLDTPTIMKVHEIAQSKQVRDMADIREKLTFGNVTPATKAADLQQPAPVQQVVPTPPVAAPVTPPTTPSDPRALLASAQQLLNQTAAPHAPTMQPAAPAAPAAPSSPAAGAATTAATIENLISQLS